MHRQAPLAARFVLRALQLDTLRIVLALLGPPSTGKRANLSVRRLVDSLRAEGHSVSDLEAKLTAVATDEQMARDRRNKMLMHFDLPTLAPSQSAAPFLIVDVLDRLLKAISDVLSGAGVLLKATGCDHHSISIGNQGLAFRAMVHRGERMQLLTQEARDGQVTDDQVRRLARNLTDRGDATILDRPMRPWQP